MENLQTERLIIEDMGSEECEMYDLKLIENGVYIGSVTVDKKYNISYYIDNKYLSTNEKRNRYLKEAVRAITRELINRGKSPKIKALEDPMEKIKDKSARIAKSCGYEQVGKTNNYIMPFHTVEQYDENLKKLDMNKMDKYKVNVSLCPEKEISKGNTNINDKKIFENIKGRNYNDRSHNRCNNR